MMTIIIITATTIGGDTGIARIGIRMAAGRTTVMLMADTSARRDTMGRMAEPGG
jgi:hypothetical protein